MIEDIQAVQNEIEDNLLEVQPAVEATAVGLYRTNPALMKRYLTDYSSTHGDLTVRRWRELAEYLIVKYNDGYINRRNAGYPDEWLKRVIKENPQQFRLNSIEQ